MNNSADLGDGGVQTSVDHPGGYGLRKEHPGVSVHIG